MKSRKTLFKITIHPVGFLWYGPLFGNPWMASVGLDEEQIEQNSNMVKVFGVTLVLEFVMALFKRFFSSAIQRPLQRSMQATAHCMVF